ncbi:Oxidoreductase FAD/NAD(P)-binding domain protein [Rubrivivax sp. A210]|uniref:2Fe-2S iron-sulfur cluster-binding protein n=1 Tax=Rubrivivax sp. A210 TaxID=2772301 RepID=UPI001917F613|nr:2Fe-2S iron-sulfur cluster-binding protein [Rubrivivax sp. A210]CAD5372781.1 Oxidoreductase FAD/NAD(P)-binding domain protein [Rubrivivax sp. A210]
MTAAELLALIAAALLLQLMVGLGWMVWRQRSGAAMAPPPTAGAATAAKARAAWAGWREFRVERREFEDAAQTQCSFYLQPADGQPLPAFKPGQFLTFGLDVGVPAADGSVAKRAITRCYSLSDRPDPAHYRVTIKRVPPPVDHPGFAPGLSSNHFHDHVQAGDILRVKAPGGHFFIDEDPNLPAVLIAGGIGITPMMCMLRWCIAQQPQRTVHLYYGMRNGHEHAFKTQLEAFALSHPALRLNIVYSRPGEADLQGRDYQHRGHVDGELLRRTLPHGRHAFLVCGPPAMMQTLVPALAAWGVPPGDIHFEAFGPASVKLPGGEEAAAPSASGFEVSFQRSGRTLAWDGRDASLLDFAERHGVEVESGCRSGGCGSCQTRLLEGSVQYAQAPDHDVAAGHCLLCVGRPSSALVLEA